MQTNLLHTGLIKTYPTKKINIFSKIYKKSPICTKKRQQKLTDENLLTNIGLIFVSKITNIRHFIFCFFHIIAIMLIAGQIN